LSIVLAHEGRNRRREASAERVGVEALLGAGKQPQQRHRVAPANRDHVDLFAVEMRVVRRGRSGHSRALRRHRYGFRHCAHVHLERAERQTAGREYVVSFALDHPESGRLDANRVRAGYQRVKGEVAIFVCDGRPRVPVQLEGQFDRRSGMDLPLGSPTVPVIELVCANADAANSIAIRTLFLM